MLRWLKQLLEGSEERELGYQQRRSIASSFISSLSERRKIGSMEIGETVYAHYSAMRMATDGQYWLNLDDDALLTCGGNYFVEITRRPDGYRAYVTYSQTDRMGGWYNDVLNSCRNQEWNPEGWTLVGKVSWRKYTR